MCKRRNPANLLPKMIIWPLGTRGRVPADLQPGQPAADAGQLLQQTLSNLRGIQRVSQNPPDQPL